MIGDDAYWKTLDEIKRLANRIAALVDELRPVTASLMAGQRGANLEEKNNRLLAEIGALDEQQERLRQQLS